MAKKREPETKRAGEERHNSTYGMRTAVATCKKKMNVDQCPTLYTKINTRWIMNLNVKDIILKLLKRNTGQCPYNSKVR